MLDHFEKGWKAADSFRDLNELYGDGIISQSQVERWFKKFKTGNTNLEDEEGRGRLSDFNVQALLAAVEEDESMTTRMLAEEFNANQSTLVRRLKRLEKVWKLSGWVPHEFSDSNKTERVRIFTDLGQLNERAPFLKNIVTGDEPWLLFKNLKRKKVCVSPGVDPKRTPKDNHCKKATWCVWWDKAGIINWEIISNGFC
nr:Transposase domain containing protein [Haemonchus contortus]